MGPTSQTGKLRLSSQSYQKLGPRDPHSQHHVDLAERDLTVSLVALVWWIAGRMASVPKASCLWGAQQTGEATGSTSQLLRPEKDPDQPEGGSPRR